MKKHRLSNLTLEESKIISNPTGVILFNIFCKTLKAYSSFIYFIMSKKKNHTIIYTSNHWGTIEHLQQPQYGPVN